MKNFQTFTIESPELIPLTAVILWRVF